MPDDEHDEPAEELGLHHGVHSHRAAGILESDAVEQAAFQYAAQGEEPQAEGDLQGREKSEAKGIDVYTDPDGSETLQKVKVGVVERPDGYGRNSAPERGDVPDHQGQRDAEAHLEHAVVDKAGKGPFRPFVMADQIDGHPDERKGQSFVGNPRPSHDSRHAGAHEEEHHEEGQPPEEGREPGSPDDVAGPFRNPFVEPHQRVALAAHQQPVGQVLEKSGGPLILRSGEIVWRRDDPHEIGDQYLARHEGGNEHHHEDQGQFVSGQHPGRPPRPQGGVDDEEQEEEGDQDRDGQVPYRHAGGLQNKRAEGHPDVDQDGEGQAQDDGAAGYAGRSQYARPLYTDSRKGCHDSVRRNRKTGFGGE